MSDERAFFAARGFGGAAGFPRRPALLVVDLCVGFTDPSSPLGSDLDAVVDANVRLLAAFRERELPVVFTTIAYDAAAEREAAVFLRKVPSLEILRPGTPWVQIDPRLGRREEEPLLVKAVASAFFGTGLAPILAGAGCDGVVVTGATTSGCVRASVVDALQHNYAPVVPREAVGDRSAAAHEQSLFDMEQKYGDVVEVEAVLAALAGPVRAGSA
jgi:nicotinamidase-related amidase